MSTRATYRFIGVYGTDTTVYIHHDGYPSGAAGYFQQALDYTDGSGNLVDKFIRANSGAEITTSHAGHRDTEYRYTVTEKLPTDSHARTGIVPMLLVETRFYDFADKHAWRKSSPVELKEFIESNLPKESD